MAMSTTENSYKKYSFEDAMDLTGFGKYNIFMLITCCLLIQTMLLDIFGFSVVMPAVACDMGLSSAQQGVLSSIPFIGVMLSSYGWGLSADTMGRRTTLLLAMPVGVVFNLAATLAPDFSTLAVLKFLSGSFSTSANAAAFVLLGESLPSRYRNKFMFYMVMCTMITQFNICVFAIPIFKLSFRIDVPWLSIEYRPWRLLLQCLCLPGILGCICIALLKESAKYLLSKEKENESLEVLKFIYKMNTGKDEHSFPVESMFLENVVNSHSGQMTLLRRMWTQTAPLFQQPLLKNTVILNYLILCAYMTATGFTMWVPTITNAYFSGNDITGKTFCEVASSAAENKNTTIIDCDKTIQPNTFYSVMAYSGMGTLCNFLLSFAVGPLGKKNSTILVFVVSVISGILLIFIRIPMISVALFYIFLYVALILGNVNTYLVELNPTHLRGMATCLSVVVARGFGFISVQLIASVMGSYCIPMISGYLLVVVSGLIVSFFLPTDVNTNYDDKSIASTKIAEDTQKEDT